MKFKIVNKEKYEDLKKEHKLLKEGVLECFAELTTKNFYSSRYSYPTVPERLKLVVKTLKNTATFYKELTTFKDSLSPPQWEIEDYKYQINEMQDKIDEQAVYIEKMRSAYYASNLLMEEAKHD